MKETRTYDMSQPIGISDIRKSMSVAHIKMSKIVNVVEATYVVMSNATGTLESSDLHSSLLLAIQKNSLSLLQNYHAGQAEKCIARIECIISLLAITKRTNTLSAMNVDLLVEGYQYVLEASREYSIESKEVEVFTRTRDVSQSIGTTLDFLYQGVDEVEDQKDKDILVSATSEITVKKDSLTPVKNISTHTHTTTPIVDNKNIEKNAEKKDDNADRQTSRRQEILSILSETPISIKDIAMHIVGCSEKTIQRELNLLLDQRKIKKIGEKRWSKYMLR